MSERQFAGRWKEIEVPLKAAAASLFENEAAKHDEDGVEEYNNNLAVNELELAMNVLEDLAWQYGASREFWQKMVKVAALMELEHKVVDYESAALAAE